MSAVTTAPFAFLASWAHTMFTLPQCFPMMKEAIANLLISNQPAGSIGYDLYNSLPTDEFLPDLVMNHIKLQHRLRENHHKSKVQEFMDHLSTSRDRFRFRSLQGQGAGAWLSAVPSISALALSSKEFNLATLIRLGCKIPQSTGRCDCGRDFDQEGYHLVTCKTGGGPIRTHNAIVHVWSDCLTELNFHHSKEPTHQYLNNDNRPDIASINPQTGHDTELDISLAPSLVH